MTTRSVENHVALFFLNCDSGDLVELVGGRPPNASLYLSKNLLRQVPFEVGAMPPWGRLSSAFGVILGSAGGVAMGRVFGGRTTDGDSAVDTGMPGAFVLRRHTPRERPNFEFGPQWGS